jgi:uncharacterized SAM-binding protein YcdF (DUF218 family)
MITEEIKSMAKRIWDYHQLFHPLEKSDCILVLGSHDLRVAHWGAALYLQGWAPLIIFSGGLGHLTREIWTKPEADQFAEIALKSGVPQQAILIENQSTNTGENIVFTRQLLIDRHIDPASFIVVQKPYMERRSFATFRKIWPEKKLIVSSPPVSFEDYPNEEISMEKVIQVMVGDLQRIKIYPQKGFQIYQEIPEEVWRAYLRLVELGFDKHLI